MKIYKDEERIDTQVQSINFKGYLILQILTIGLLLLKMYLINISMISVGTELLILVVGNLYIFIRAMFLRVNLVDFLKGKDEFNLVYRNKIFSQAFYLSFILMGIMTILILLLGRVELIFFIAIEFFISGSYVTYKNVKEGLLIPRIKITKKKDKLRFILILVIILLGTLGSDWEFLRSNKSLIIKIGRILFDTLANILFILIPIHFTMKALIKKSEKNADKLNN